MNTNSLRDCRSTRRMWLTHPWNGKLPKSFPSADILECHEGPAPSASSQTAFSLGMGRDSSYLGIENCAHCFA